MADPWRVAVVGGGTIGSGWAAHFLRMGLDVRAFDPAPGAEERVRVAVARAWPSLVELGLRDAASPDRLTFASSLAEAVADADLVQESTPERIEAKVAIFAELDAAAPPHAILASSTSALPMTQIQARCRRPERTVVAHPFNPPYLIPLVEVVGGERTSEETVERACAFYAAMGKEVVRLRGELYGFIANRLQDAVWREMLHLIADGAASFEDVDRAIVHGPGLRWAIAGPGLVYHMAGGSGGMAQCLEHFQSDGAEAYSHMPGPPLTDDLRAALVEAAEREAAGRSMAELERLRDATIVQLLRARTPL
jgi:carnitine 3-dehydrogenase